jgi:hypothetical protein
MKETHSTKRIPIPMNLLKDLSSEYKRLYGINPMNQTRQTEYVIPRQCLGYILTYKYSAGVSAVGRLFKCNHATILYSNKRVLDALEIKDTLYIEALNRWMLVFDNLSKEVKEATNSKEIVKKRVLDYVSSCVSDGSLKAEDITDLFKSLLKITSQETPIG